MVFPAEITFVCVQFSRNVSSLLGILLLQYSTIIVVFFKIVVTDFTPLLKYGYIAHKLLLFCEINLSVQLWISNYFSKCLIY